MRQKKDNEVYGMVDAGINFHRIFTEKHDDVLGLVCVSSLTGNSEKHETAIELTYKYQVISSIYLQPDIQMVLNPSAAESLDYALIAMLRLGIEL